MLVDAVDEDPRYGVVGVARFATAAAPIFAGDNGLLPLALLVLLPAPNLKLKGGPGLTLNVSCWEPTPPPLPPRVCDF